MLSFVLGGCSTLVKEIEQVCSGSGHVIEIYNSASHLLNRLADPELPSADTVFVNIGRVSQAAADRVISKAKSADSRTTIVAVTEQRAGTTQAPRADYVLGLPADLRRLPKILCTEASPVQEIITRRELEQKLAQAQQKMQTILDNLTQGVAVVDRAGTVVRVNATLVRMYGAPDASAFLGKPCHRALWGLLEPCDNCPRLTSQASIEDSRTLHIGDRALRLDVSAAVLSDGALGVIETIRDATPRLELEESLLESEKMKAVGLMAAGLAHELCNPIAIINSTAEYCMQTQDDEELESAFETILNATGQAEKVIRELLNFARPAPNHFELCSPGDLLRATAGMVAAQCKTHRVKLVVDLPDALPAINADRSRLQQALLNFLLNGIEAMEQGGTLAVAARPVGQTTLEIQISDTGAGMTPEQRQRVFEPFFTGKHGGVGLGMPNARRIVTAHRGKVTISSEPGEGTIVTIVLPAAELVNDFAAETA